MGWQSMNTAPLNVTVEIEAGGMIFPARLLGDAAMTSEEESCDQWVAMTDVYPDCWSEGACWEVNEDENMSAQPERWRHIDQVPA